MMKSIQLDKKKKGSFYPNVLTLVKLILLEDSFNVKQVKDMQGINSRVFINTAILFH